MLDTFAEALGLSDPKNNQPALYNDYKAELAGDSGGFGLMFQGRQNYWEWDATDWYKVFPYQIIIAVKGKTKDDKDTYKYKYYFTLPIPPQSLITKMQPASQATASLGGVVEETSENTFWHIQLAGTTGIAPSRGDTTDRLKRKDVAKEFRTRLETTGLMAGMAANLSSMAAKAGGLADIAVDTVKGTEAAFTGGANPMDSVLGAAEAIADGAVQAIQTALLPPMPYAGSAVSSMSNGYTEIQELHRFLYTYSKLKGQNPGKFQLVFRNMKDQTKWNVVLQDFTIQRNAQNPMLYRYNLQFKGWDIRSIGDVQRNEFDRFGLHGDLKSVILIEGPQILNIMGKMAENLNGKGWMEGKY